MLSQPVVELSNRDLLAILVGEGQADCMLLETGGCLSDMLPSEPSTVLMAREPGADYSNRAMPRIVLEAARELSRRCLAEELSKPEQCMSSPSKVKDYLKHSLGSLPYEAFMALWLDAQMPLRCDWRAETCVPTAAPSSTASFARQTTSHLDGWSPR